MSTFTVAGKTGFRCPQCEIFQGIARKHASGICIACANQNTTVAAEYRARQEEAARTYRSSEQWSRDRKEARYQGAWAFVDGEVFRRSNIISSGKTLYSYGTHFPMAMKIGRDVWVNTNRYSVTTSKHQGALVTVLGICGYVDTGNVTTYDGHTGTIWTRANA